MEPITPNHFKDVPTEVMYSIRDYELKLQELCRDRDEASLNYDSTFSQRLVENLKIHRTTVVDKINRGDHFVIEAKRTLQEAERMVEGMKSTIRCIEKEFQVEYLSWKIENKALGG